MRFYWDQVKGVLELGALEHCGVSAPGCLSSLEKPLQHLLLFSRRSYQLSQGNKKNLPSNWNVIEYVSILLKISFANDSIYYRAQVRLSSDAFMTNKNILGCHSRGHNYAAKKVRADISFKSKCLSSTAPVTGRKIVLKKQFWRPIKATTNTETVFLERAL